MWLYKVPTYLLLLQLAINFKVIKCSYKTHIVNKAESDVGDRFIICFQRRQKYAATHTTATEVLNEI